MIRRSCEIYLVLALLAATLLSSLPQSAIALLFLLLGLYIHLRKPEPRWRILVVLGYFLVIPLLLEPVLYLFSALVVIPAFPLISSSLKENALTQTLSLEGRGQKEGKDSPKARQATNTLKSLIAAVGIILFASLLLANWTLAITSGMVLILIAGILIYLWRRLPLFPVEVEQKGLKVIAGNTTRLTTRLKNRAKIPLHIFVKSGYSWVHIGQTRFWNLFAEAELDLTITPTLSGPSQPQIEMLVVDSWGLIQMRQLVKPVNLYVIPRARYAEWLAKKYLEETAPPAGAILAMLPAAATVTAPKSGVEYYTSRPYQPGDRLKDIDWKHTVKLQEIVVKEYIEDTRQMAIIAVNLTAANIEEADKLVYNLITSALTLAREAIPTAVAAYSQEQVLTATPPLDPREVVKKALQLGQRVVLLAPVERYLQSPDIRQVRTSLRRLERTNAEPARKLRAILELERRAIEEGAKEHPATRALNRVTAHTLPPAMITVISARNHDNEALSVTLEDLRKRGYSATLMKIS